MVGGGSALTVHPEGEAAASGWSGGIPRENLTGQRDKGEEDERVGQVREVMASVFFAY